MLGDTNVWARMAGQRGTRKGEECSVSASQGTGQWPSALDLCQDDQFLSAPKGHNDEDADPLTRGEMGLRPSSAAFMLQKGPAFSDRHSSEEARGVRGGQLPRHNFLTRDSEQGGSPE